jgi:integrase
MTPVHQPDAAVVTLDQLISRGFFHLEELGYTKGSREHYASVWRALADFAQHSSAPPEFTSELANDFLDSRGISRRVPFPQRRGLTRTQKQTRRALGVLLEFQTTGHFGRQPKQEQEPAVPTGLRHELARYEEFCGRHLRLCPATLAARRRTLPTFLAFLESKGATSPGDLQPSLLSAYIVARSREIQLRTLATQVGDIRSFLRFLCMEGLVSPDLLVHAKTFRFSKEHRLPPIWPAEAVETLLAAVDRSSAVGKRNYAILLLACRLGLRAGDIRGLCLEDLSWPDSRLTITQKKTGQPLSLPLEDEVGEALIDYLTHARPAVPHREVFLRTRAPFEPFSLSNSLRNVVEPLLHRAQIELPRGVPRGLHALRHTLATRLVGAGEPLETVAGILGHRSIETTRVYTHLDVESLRSVALDPEEVLHD